MKLFKDLPWYERVTIKIGTFILYLPLILILLIPTLIFGILMLVYSKLTNDFEH